MANTYLTRTQGSGNRKTFTQSFWCKIADTSGTQSLAGAFDDGNNYSYCYLDGGNLKLQWKSGGSVIATLDTNRKFRDPNAFYNIVYAVDTTQSTASDRIKLYVNGVQETSFSTATYPSENASSEINGNGITYNIGSASSGQNFNGLMSYVAFVDGTQELPTIFGETDSTTGEWKIKTSITPSVAWGNNGFLILKNGNSLTDESSNSNNFTLGGGTLTKIEDNPSNNFCNINTLYNQTTGQGVVVNNCGNTVYYASNSSRSCFGSIAPSSGKYYFEAKVFGGTGTVVIGIVNMAWSNLNGASGYAFHDDALNFGYNVSGQKTSGGTNTAYGSAIADNDIVGVAMDLDNSKLYFSLNGVFQGSGVPTSGASGTYAAFTLASGANYTAACRLRNGTQVGFNFGNGQYSGSNVVTTNSGDGYSGTDGASKFTYQPPTGYSAINTKGLNL